MISYKMGLASSRFSIDAKNWITGIICPILEFRFRKDPFACVWRSCVSDFFYPIRIRGHRIQKTSQCFSTSFYLLLLDLIGLYFLLVILEESGSGH